MFGETRVIPYSAESLVEFVVMRRVSWGGTTFVGSATLALRGWDIAPSPPARRIGQVSRTAAFLILQALAEEGSTFCPGAVFLFPKNLAIEHDQRGVTQVSHSASTLAHVDLGRNMQQLYETCDPGQ